jgi:hypothetical protein
MKKSPGKKEPAIPLPVILAAAFVFIVSNLFSYFIFEHIPHINDEIDYVFQAKVFLSGRLYASSPCGKEFFDFPHMINNGRWYSQYPPGFPFLLMIGLAANLSWIINPLLAALAILLFYYLGKEIYDCRTGIYAALLGAISPWILLMSATMLSHTSSLVFTALFLLFLFRGIKKPSVQNGILAGTALGIALLIRPYNAVLFSLPFLVYYGVHLIRDFRARSKNGLAFASALILFAGMLLTYNQLTNGHPLRMGYVVSYGEGVLPGLGHAPISGHALTPLVGVENIWAYLKAVNSDLFGWPLSSFLALLPLLWIWRIDPKGRKKDLLLAAGFLSLLAGFFFYWGTFLLMGARLIFEGATLLALLSARGIAQLPGLLGQISRNLQPKATAKIMAVVLAAFIFYAFAYYFPRFLWPPHQEWYFNRYDHDFGGTTARLHRAVCDLGLKKAVIVLKFLQSPPPLFPDGGWGSGFLHDDPDLKSQIIYARAAGDSWDNLMSCFPGRDFYLYVGTLDKGMLLPLEKEGGHILHGQALPPAEKSRRAIALVQNPKSFFRVYSPEFANFLERVYREQDVAEIDASRLAELGRLNQTQGHFREAAFYFEAALQVENEPETRRVLLDLLIPCYFKTGQAREAKIISRYMEKVHYNERKLYAVFPERGF